jgi:hypothetical protein
MLNETQITELRTRYAAINRIDPDGKAYAGICKLLGSLSQSDLKMLAGAKIKFISKLALNRVR